MGTIRTQVFRLTTALLLGAPVALMAAPGGVSDFRLPPGPGATPAAEGPSDAGVPSPRINPEMPDIDAAPTPRPTATPRPTPPPGATATPAPSPAPSPSPGATPRPAASATSSPTPSPTPLATPSAQETPATAEPPIEEPAADPAQDTSGTPAPASATPSVSLEGGPQAAAESGLPAFLPWLIVLALFGLAWAAGWFWWRKQQDAPATVPPVERPRPKAPPPPPPAPEAAPQPAATPAPAAVSLGDENEALLTLAVEPRRLAVTLIQTALTYRLILSNGSEQTLQNIAVQGDVISAHSSLSTEEQTARADSALPDLHHVPRLRAGESVVLEGKIELPLPMVRPIRRGGMALFVPLLRLRLTTPDGPSLLQTTLIGQRSPDVPDKLQPFRLDLGPRIYSELLQRSFA